MATSQGHTSTALALIAHKDSNVTVQDADNQEPIHHAVRKGDIRLTAALMEEGAKLKEVSASPINSPLKRWLSLIALSFALRPTSTAGSL